MLYTLLTLHNHFLIEQIRSICLPILIVSIYNLCRLVHSSGNSDVPLVIIWSIMHIYLSVTYCCQSLWLLNNQPIIVSPLSLSLSIRVRLIKQSLIKHFRNLIITTACFLHMKLNRRQKAEMLFLIIW